MKNSTIYALGDELIQLRSDLCDESYNQLNDDLLSRLWLNMGRTRDRFSLCEQLNDQLWYLK
jgi:hypothetical protein